MEVIYFPLRELKLIRGASWSSLDTTAQPQSFQERVMPTERVRALRASAPPSGGERERRGHGAILLFYTKL